MADFTGATAGASSYDLTNGLKVLIDEAIYMLSPEQLPLLNGLAADGQTVLSTEKIDQIKHEWLEEENKAPRSSLATAITSATSVVFGVATGDGVKFGVGDIISVKGAGLTTSQPELIRVASVSGDELTCVRAYDSIGTAIAYATGSVVMGIGTALAEGSTPQAFQAKDTVTKYNYSQIFGPYEMKMTGTGQVVPRYGIPDQWGHQLGLRMYETAQAREQAIMYGRRYNSTTTKIRTMGGLVEFITSNVNTTANTTLTLAGVETMMQTCFNNGAVPDRLLINPNSGTTLTDATNTTIVRTTLDDARRGRVRTSYLITEYGDIPLVRSRWVHPYEAFGIRRDNVTRQILRPMIMEKLAKTGDFDQAMFLCEESLKVKGQEQMFRFAGLTSYTAV
jgi:hypothetical protein